MKKSESTQITFFPDDTDVAPTVYFRGLRLSPKQAAIMEHLESSGQITLTEAVRLVGGNIFHNRKKYVGLTLSRMVSKGLIERVGPGVFRIAEQ